MTANSKGNRSASPAEFLLRELASRKAVNGNYSLRSFARDAGIYPSKMSEILRNKCGISGPRARKIAQNLKWDSVTSEIFHDSVVNRFSRSPKKRLLASQSVNAYLTDPRRHLKETEFRVVSDWYHLAALSLAEITGGTLSREILCQHLRISKAQADAALRRLCEMNFLENIDGAYILKSNSALVPSVRSSQAIKTFHGQLMEKARNALQNHSSTERDNSAVILTMSKGNIQKAKALIRDFRKKFLELMSAESEAEFDSVYCLSMQLFEIAHVKKSTQETP